MPSRNVIKVDVPESFYHVYARGAGKNRIFLDTKDFEYFEMLMERYLSNKPATPKLGHVYPHFKNKVEILSYCLMGNHFHLLLFQKDSYDMSAFMKSIMTSYSRYFNLKYKRSGPLFESRYKASLVSQQSYLQHISRYIHLNPRYWLRYPHSSLKFYLNNDPPEWLKIDTIMSLFSDRKEYLHFHEDYEDQKQVLDEIKHELAS